MLRRNRFGFRLRRRSLSNRLLQAVVVMAVLALFTYFLIYAVGMSGANLGAADYTWLKTRNMSVYVAPERRTVLLEPDGSSACSLSQRLRLVAIVFSAPENAPRRNVIRNTWGAGLRALPGVKVFFMLGRSTTKEWQNRVALEHKQHNDIIQEDLVEAYLNITIKTTFMLKWISGNDCSTSKFIFKVDDDTFVNPTIFWDQLEHSLLHTTTTKSLHSYLPIPPPGATTQAPSESVDYLFMGHVMHAVPIRDQASKWYLPPKFYPLNIFPSYTSGSGYVFTSSVIPALYTCALRTPYLNLEDVFLSGLCATTQLGLKLTHNPSFHFRKPIVGPNYVCFYKNSALIHPLDADEIDAMYPRLKDDCNCDTFYFAFIRGARIAAEFLKNLFRL